MLSPSSSQVHPHPCGSCVVHDSFCALPEALRPIFEALKTSASYAKGEVIVHEGDPCHSVLVVCAGSVKLVTSSNEGRVLLLRFAIRGSLLGLTEALVAPESYLFTAVAAEPAVVALIPREIFLRFVTTYPEACLRMTVALSEQYRMAQRETKFLAFGGTSTSRLAHVLLDEAQEHGRPSTDGIPANVTHSEFAQLIGSTRETVTRVLGNLDHKGIIERNAEEIIIHDTANLARLGTY